MNYIDLIITIFLILSILSFALSVIGIIRFPEFYTRVHAASKGDTLSTMLLLVGVIIYVIEDYSGISSILTIIKILCILGFMFLTGPTGIHTLINAGYELGRKPFSKNPVHNNDDDNMQERL